MKSFSEIVTSMRTYLRTKWPNVVQTEDTIVDDIVVKSVATEVDRLTREVAYNIKASSFEGFREILADETYQESLKAVFDLDSLGEVQAKISADLDAFVTTFGVSPRQAGAKATTTVVLLYSSAALVTASAGAQILVPSAVPVLFEVAATVTGTPVFRSAGIYVLNVEAVALEIGTTHNVPANSITESQGGLGGVIGVENPADVTNGLDEETDLNLINRAETWLQGFSLDTKEGVRKVVLDSGVRDAYVVTPSDVNRVRAPGVDVWCLSKGYTTVVEDFEWTVETRDSGYIALKQPINEDASAFILSGFPDAVITVEKDTGANAYGLSKSGRDKIVFSFPTTSPTLTDTLTLTYSYNSSLETIEALFLEPNPELFADLLMKEAIEKKLSISLRVKVFPDQVPDLDALKATIIGQIKSQINVLLLGESYDQSDLIIAVGTIAGVDRVVVEIYDFVGSTGILVTPSVDFNEYLSATDSNIVIDFELT